MQFVRSGNVIADAVVMEKGVPQGSILGPLLFLLYVNDICATLKHSEYQMHADDTVLYCSAPSPEIAVASLQSDFSSLQHALSDRKLMLNANKTKALLFAPSKTRVPSLSVNTMEGVGIEYVDTY